METIVEKNRKFINKVINDAKKNLSSFNIYEDEYQRGFNDKIHISIFTNGANIYLPYKLEDHLDITNGMEKNFYAFPIIVNYIEKIAYNYDNEKSMSIDVPDFKTFVDTHSFGELINK